MSNRPSALAKVTFPAALGAPRVISGTAGVWTDVTPVGIDLNVASNGGDNYAVQDVLPDPSQAGTFYAYVCYQGCWRSRNYGETWTKVSTTANMDAGKNWGGDIAPDGSYMVCAQSSRNAVLKSTDGGVTWVETGSAGTELYHAAISPFDKTRAVASSHESGNNHMFESLDSCATWTDMGVVNASVGASGYIHYLHNSDTILFIPEGVTNVYRGTKSAGTWTWAAVTDLSNIAHAHGSHQIFHDVTNSAFFLGSADTGGTVGIWKSTNNGSNWTRVYTAEQENAVIGTPTKLYAMTSFPIGSGNIDNKFTSADRNPGTSWATAADPGMLNGAKRFAVGTDGVKWVVLAGCWHAGIWRYVEPT